MRCRSPSFVKTRESKYIRFKYSLGCFLIVLQPPLSTHRSERPMYEGRKPPPCAAHTFKPGKRSSVPSKIKWDKAIVVAMGLPTKLTRFCAPLNRARPSGNSKGPMG